MVWRTEAAKSSIFTKRRSGPLRRTLLERRDQAVRPIPSSWARTSARERSFACAVPRASSGPEELLLGEDVTKRLYTLRRVLGRMNALDAMPLLIDRLMKTDTNQEFLDSFRLED